MLFSAERDISKYNFSFAPSDFMKTQLFDCIRIKQKVGVFDNIPASRVQNYERLNYFLKALRLPGMTRKITFFMFEDDRKSN